VLRVERHPAAQLPYIVWNQFLGGLLVEDYETFLIMILFRHPIQQAELVVAAGTDWANYR